jgi:leucyl-tRNA synthetase
MVKGEGVTAELESVFHKTIKKVSEDIEGMKFNTAIAQMMILINAIYDHGSLTKDELGIFARLLCPFAPHISEEIWESIGSKGLCSVAEWPAYDEAKTVDATVEYAVQVLGKLRGTVTVNVSDDKDTVIAKAKAVDKVVPFLEGKTVVKEIFVPNKLVNFVVK